MSQTILLLESNKRQAFNPGEIFFFFGSVFPSPTIYPAFPIFSIGTGSPSNVVTSAG